MTFVYAINTMRCFLPLDTSNVHNHRTPWTVHISTDMFPHKHTHRTPNFHEFPAGPRRKISVYLRPWLQEKYASSGPPSTRPHTHPSHGNSNVKCPSAGGHSASLASHQSTSGPTAPKATRGVQPPQVAAVAASGKRAAAPAANLRAQYLKSLSSEQSATACEAVGSQENSNRRKREVLSLSQLYSVTLAAWPSVLSGEQAVARMDHSRKPGAAAIGL